MVGTLWEHISRVLWLSCLRKSTAFLKLVMTKACKETPFSEQPQNASWITNSLTIHTRWNSTLRVMNFLQGYSDIFLDSCNHSCMHHSTLYYPCDHFPINGLLYHLKYEVKLLSRVWLFGTPWIVLPGSSVHGIFQAILVCQGCSENGVDLKVTCVSLGLVSCPAPLSSLALTLPCDSL